MADVFIGTTAGCVVLLLIVWWLNRRGDPTWLTLRVNTGSRLPFKGGRVVPCPQGHRSWRRDPGGWVCKFCSEGEQRVVGTCNWPGCGFKSDQWGEMVVHDRSHFATGRDRRG